MNKDIMRKFLYALLIILVGLQFYQSDRNTSADNSKGLETKFSIPFDVKTTLEQSCYDCHSNHTNYPWYAQFQPVGIWLQNHIKEGKRHLNFSTLGGRPAYLQQHKMEEIEEMIAMGEMPMKSYTLIHRNAVLDSSRKVAIIRWTKVVRDSLAARFPADSLKMPARKK